MSTFTYIRQQGKQQKSDILLLSRGMFDPDVPWYVKTLVILIIAYIVSPVDLIPDFIPVLGLLDEIILVPIMASLAARLIPEHIRLRYTKAESVPHTDKLPWLGIALVITAWIVVLFVCYQFW